MADGTSEWDFIPVSTAVRTRKSVGDMVRITVGSSFIVVLSSLDVG